MAQGGLGGERDEGGGRRKKEEGGHKVMRRLQRGVLGKQGYCVNTKPPQASPTKSTTHKFSAPINIIEAAVE